MGKEEGAMRIQLNRILCATDFSDLSNRTIPFGISLAKTFSARLSVCHIIDLPFAAMNGEVQLDPIEQQEQMTVYAQEQLAQLFEKESVSWEPLVSIGHTADEISRIVEKERIDLVISATHGRSGLKRLLLGSVTERLMRILSCPLLIINGREEAQAGTRENAFPPRRILVGCDFSADSGLAFQYGLAMAQEFESELHLVHVVEPPVYQNVLVSDDAAGGGTRASIVEQLTDKLTRMVPAEARNWCDLKTILREGKPDEELTWYAEVNDMDLIVLGVRGHGLVESLFIGSTTDRVARRAPCPVLSVRPIVKRQ
jgi:nucleotide-binding universal stress UspA family protein